MQETDAGPPLDHCTTDVPRVIDEEGAPKQLKEPAYARRGSAGIQCHLVVREHPEFPGAMDEILAALEALEKELGCRPFGNVLTEAEAPWVFDGDFPSVWGYTKLLLYTPEEFKEGLLGDGYFRRREDYYVGKIRVTNLTKELLAHEILHTFGLEHTETGIMKPSASEWDFSLVPDLCGQEE